MDTESQEMKKPATAIFLSQKMVMMLDFLTSAINTKLEYTKKDIAEGAGIGYSTLMNMWNQLEEFKLVVPTRELAGVQLFKPNKESKLLQAFNNFADELSDIIAAKAAEETIAKERKQRVKHEQLQSESVSVQ